MNIKYIFSSLIFLLPGALFSQIPLTLDSEFMRGGDFIIKTEVPFVNPGNKGKDAERKLCKLSDSRSDLWQTISKSDDCFDILEYDRLKHFELKDDILYYKRTQDSKSVVELEEGRQLLKYPFQYGDSIYSTCYGKGYNEEGQSFTVTGNSYTIADGIGYLSDGIDTMTDILRLHLHDEMKKTYENGTNELLVSDRYLWYGNNSRYPVMESVKTMLESNGSPDVIKQVSYAYFPAQSDKEVIKEDYASRRIEITKASLVLEDLKLTIYYNLDAESVTSLTATDIAGNVIGSKQYHSIEGGEGQIEITLDRRPMGGVLMLNVRNGNQQVSMRVTE